MWNMELDSKPTHDRSALRGWFAAMMIIILMLVFLCSYLYQELNQSRANEIEMSNRIYQAVRRGE